MKNYNYGVCHSASDRLVTRRGKADDVGGRYITETGSNLQHRKGMDTALHRWRIRIKTLNEAQQHGLVYLHLLVW